jgi:large subunit ribosomal protein L15
VSGDVVDLAALQAANVLSRNVKRARIMLSGGIDRAVTVKGIKVTRGARAAIEAAGGKVED